jgi:hypothetical protein
MWSLRFALALLLFVTVDLVPSRAVDPSPGGPVIVVQALYRACLSRYTIGFNAESARFAKPYLAPDLNALIDRKLDQLRISQGAAHSEIDIFFDAKQPPKSFSIDRPVGMGPGEAWVDVTLKWLNEERVYTISLSKDDFGQKDGAWKVIDINYDKDGTLRDWLK